MKILVIDNDSERINTFKTLELNGHLVQVVATLSEVKEFLDQSVCQILVLGPEQISGDPLKIFAEWRQSLGEKPSPWVVAFGPRQDALSGIDHFFSIPFDAIGLVELMKTSGIPPEPEIIDRNEALNICDGDEELFLEISEIFIDDSPNRIEKLTRGIEEKNWKAVGEAAHLMKGSALNLAAGPFRLANQSLERAGVAENVPLIFFWSEQVIYEYNRLRGHLKGLVGESTNPS